MLLAWAFLFAGFLGRIPSQARGKLTEILSMTRNKNLKGDSEDPLLKFWLPKTAKAGHWELSATL